MVFVIVILVAFVLLLVEFALEGLVLHAPEKWALRLAWLGDVMRFVFSPLAALMMSVLGSSEALQQRLGPVTEEEIRTWVNTDQGENGLEKARELHPDLVILDLMLPKMNGYKVCELLRRDPSTCNIPIIMFTGRDEDIERELGADVGADAYITKTFQPEKLLPTINKLLGTP